MKTCLRPGCGKKFAPLPNVPNQKTCGGSLKVECVRCKGKDCRKCHGKGSYVESCHAWYKRAWSSMYGVPRSIDDAHWKKIEKALPSARPFLRVMIVIARYSGMRISELLGLTVGDVWDGKAVRGTIAVRGQWKAAEMDKKTLKMLRPGRLEETKTREPRPGFLPASAQAAIREYLKPQKNLLPETRLVPYSRGHVWAEWVEFQRKLGVKPADTDHYRFHDLRHTTATTLVRAGRKDLAKKFLGHKPGSTATDRYDTPRPEETLADAEKIWRGR